jgi:hypothetical protein
VAEHDLGEGSTSTCTKQFWLVVVPPWPMCLWFPSKK